MGAETGDTGVPDAEDPRRRFEEECRGARALYPRKPLTQTALARTTRTSKSTISRVERCDGPSPLPDSAVRPLSGQGALPSG